MFAIILINEISNVIKSHNRAISSFLFFIIFIFIANLLVIDNSNFLENEVFFWLAASSAIIFSSDNFLKEEYNNGMLEQMLICCHNFESFIFAKVIANWINYSLPIIIASAILKTNWDFFIITIFATFIINCISCFSGSFSMIGNSSPLMAIISLPLIIPTILIASDNEIALKILIPLSILTFLLTSFMMAKITKISCS